MTVGLSSIVGATLLFCRVLVFYDDGGADRDTVIEVGHVLIGHAEAARRYRLPDGLRLIRAVDSIER